MIRSWTGIVLSLAVLLASHESLAEKRVALVIGNGSYSTIGALRNPPNDARLMSATLRQLGFDVIERIDADQKAMKKAVREFGKQLETAGKDAVGLFYYAGHGVQVGGTNYMIPVKVEIADESDVDIEAVSANAVLGEMAFAGNRLNIVVMDACRNNPFRRGFRSVSRGLARMDATKGTLIAYATSPGDVAVDGEGRNSPYTEALSKAMLTQGLTVERMFKVVRNQVVAATKSKQVPWEASSLTGADFYFRGDAPAVASTAASDSDTTRETTFWQSIKDSENLAEFEAFITAFPESPFSALARTRIDALRQKEVVTLTPQSPAAPSSRVSSGDDADVEIAFWNSIEDSNDKDSFEAYMAQYPTGRFYSLAALRLKRITEKADKLKDRERQITNLKENFQILNGKWCGSSDNFVLSSASSANVTFDNNYLSGIVGNLEFDGNEFSVELSYSFSTYKYFYKIQNFDTIHHFRTDGSTQNQTFKRCG